MEARLASNVCLCDLRNMRRSLIHHYDQVPVFVKCQQLSEKMHNFWRGDPFVVQREHQPTSVTQCRHSGNTPSLASHSHPWCVSARRPRLAKKGCQRHVGFILEVQNRLELPYRFANSGHFGSQPLLPSFFVQLKVLPLRLLIRQSRIPQPSPDSVLRESYVKDVLNYLLQSSYSPQICLKLERRSWFEDDRPNVCFREILQQPRPTTARSPTQAFLSVCIVAGKPAKKSRPINTIGLAHYPNWQSLNNGFYGSSTNLIGRMPSLAHGQALWSLSHLGQDPCCNIYAMGHTFSPSSKSKQRTL